MIMAADFPGCTRGLAVALEDACFDNSAEMAWQDPTETLKHFQDGNNFNHPRKKDFASVATNRFPKDNINRIYGYQNSIVLRAYNEHCNATGKSGYIVKPVAAVDEFKGANPAPDHSTGWFLPSVKELYILFNRDIADIFSNQVYNPDGLITRDIVNSSLAAARGDKLDADSDRGVYWSSTEWGTAESYWNGREAFCVSGCYARVSISQKTSLYRVRAMCAF